MKRPFNRISVLPVAMCAWGIVGCATDAPGEPSADAEQLTSLEAKTENGKPPCIEVRGDLVENSFTEGCKPGHNSCFRGELTGRHGLHATTYFKADSGVTGPETSPRSSAYSGAFEYTTDRGTLEMRETGVNVPEGDPTVRTAATAYQQITGATGALTGATGHFFVSGFVTDNPDGSRHVVTEVTGEICPAH